MMRKAIYTTIFLGAFGIYLLIPLRNGTLNAPPELGDGQDYDAIAFNIAHHRGFGFDWDDPDWREPYLQFPRYREVLNRHSNFYPTTYRSPGMPYLLASIYQLAGRNFAAWRIVSCAIMAAAVTLAAAIAAEFAGILAAVPCTLLALLSAQLMMFSRMFLTESLATFLLTLSAWLWLSNTRSGWTIKSAVAFGMVLGVLVATRSLFLLWLPVAFFIPGTQTSAGVKSPWLGKAICLVVSLLVIGPWWVRNILVTGAFMPFGTQSAIGLPGGFSPRALQLQGVWAPDDGDGIPELSAQNLDPLTFEVRLAQIRLALATNWMMHNRMDVLRLVVLHVWQEIRPRGDRFSDWLFPAAALAAFVLGRSRGVGIVIAFACLSLLSVGLTWSAEGRFMVPMQPLLVALVAAMATVLVRQSVTPLRRALAFKI